MSGVINVNVKTHSGAADEIPTQSRPIEWAEVGHVHNFNEPTLE